MRDLDFYLTREKADIHRIERKGLYGYLRYFDIQRSMNEFRSQSEKFNRIYIIHLLLAPITITWFMVSLFVLRKERLVFLSGRKTSDGKDVYLHKYINSKSALVNYSPTISLSAFPLVVVKIAVVCIARLSFLSTVKEEIGLPKYLIDSNRIREYMFWKLFWKLILRYSSIKEIYFTSLNFFLPIIEACRELSIQSTEIAHAIVSPLHPSYNYGFSDQFGCFADVYVENSKSFGAKCSMKGFVKFEGIVKKRSHHKNHSDNWLIIPGPFQSVEDVELALRRIRNSFLLQDYLLCVHPLDSIEKFAHYPCARLGDIELRKFSKVLGWSSNLLSELYYEGFECYTLETSACMMYESRNEKILLL